MRILFLPVFSIATSAFLTGAVLTTVGAAERPRKSSSLASKGFAKPAQQTLASVSVPPKPSPPQTPPLISVISLPDQKITVFAGTSQVARSSISSGMPGHRTPTGIFSVLGKERYHESNLYSNAPMPFMQRITWSGVALHEGKLPGYPASHGCIRLSGEFAQHLFGMSRVGMRVIVADQDLQPIAFSHPTLPVPAFTRASDVVVAAVGTEGRMNLGAKPDLEPTQLLNPMERGRLAQGQAKALALEAAVDARVLLDLAAERAAEARTTLEASQQADANLASKVALRRELEALRAQAGIGLVSAAVQGRLNELELRASDAQITATTWQANEARAEARAADEAAFRAAGEAKSAVAEQASAEHAARVASRATEPVSVFVSRKERRVFVRQGFEPVFEADVEILDIDQPLGTHVFTAIAPSDEGGSMNWVAMTIPGQARIGGEASSVRGSKSAQQLQATPKIVHVSATAALDRIKLSDDVQSAIAARLWTGASFIISDHGISNETGKGTDFVVLTK